MSPVTKSERLMVQYVQPEFNDIINLSNQVHRLTMITL